MRPAPPAAFFSAMNADNWKNMRDLCLRALSTI